MFNYTSGMAVKNPKPTGLTGDKFKSYVRMGFTDYQARRLTDVAELNVARVEDCIRKGCSVDLAYRIFRP